MITYHPNNQSILWKMRFAVRIDGGAMQGELLNTAEEDTNVPCSVMLRKTCK
jgi:hypothetical protein